MHMTINLLNLSWHTVDVFVQMCLASEAGKMDTVVSQPEDSSSSASLQQTTVKPEIKEEKTETDDCPPSSHTAALLPSLSSVTSTSTDAIPPQLSSQNARVKKKSKKKEVSKSNDNSDESPCPAKKIMKKCEPAESNMDSVFSTIEAVAKGVWKDTEEKPKKKIQSSPAGVGGNSGLPKKKNKPKVKACVKEREEAMEESSGQCGQHSSSEVEMKEETSDVSTKTEAEETSIESTELQGSMEEPQNSPCSPSPTKLKEEDKGKERSGEVDCSTERSGSRKSERSCKGALYKTLVSEGMLTSLRANIDRGITLNQSQNSQIHIQLMLCTQWKCLNDFVDVCQGKRGALRASDHDANWSDDSWTVAQLGPNNPKKLKKSKSKDESSQGWVMPPLITV